MNKQTLDGIDFCDYTWNPISGCLAKCDYCYVQRMVKRFPAISMEPAFHPDKLSAPIKRKPPSKIFVGSSGDMWGAWVPRNWINAVLVSCALAHQHTFQFLTKNPKRYNEFALPRNAWYGTTVDGTPRTERNCEILPKVIYGNLTKFISFEPLLSPVVPKLIYIDWVIIGADSTRGAEKPPDEWADTLIEIARKDNCAVWVKDNYKYKEVIKEWPDENNKLKRLLKEFPDGPCRGSATERPDNYG